MDKYVLKKEEIEAFAGTDKTHFLNPNGKRINKSLGDLTGISGFGFHLIEVPPGADSTEFHVHFHEDECTYVLSGHGIVRIGEERTDIGPGDFIGYRKGGLAHCMTNTGPEVLKCIVVGQRLAHDVGEYPDKNKRLFRNEGMKWEMVDLDKIEHPQGGKK
ncbi:MAG: cupin domain-containing protein [Terasakiella sp.]|uniref:cupin domain-containing protein n=1 Tax=unclassified Terasakiella TaxID=2614952 RepID=UPI003AFFFB25